MEKVLVLVDTVRGVVCFEEFVQSGGLHIVSLGDYLLGLLFELFLLLLEILVVLVQFFTGDFVDLIV